MRRNAEFSRGVPFGRCQDQSAERRGGCAAPAGRHVECVKGDLADRATKGFVPRIESDVGCVSAVVGDLLWGVWWRKEGVDSGCVSLFIPVSSVHPILQILIETTAAPTAHLLAALVGGCASTVAATPLWVIRTRIMTQTKAGPPPAPPPTPYFYHGIWDASKTIYRKEGPRAFYKGLAPSLLGVTHVVVQFPLYEHFKVYFSENLTSSQTPLGHDNTIQPSGILKSHSLSPLVLVLSSSISKTIASLLTYPHEVIRTRLQTQTSNTLHPCLYPISSPSNPGTTTTAASNVTPRKLYRGILGTARRILKEEGTHGLYKGFGTNLVRTVPSSVITLCTFELVRRELGWKRNGIYNKTCRPRAVLVFARFVNAKGHLLVATVPNALDIGKKKRN